MIQVRVLSRTPVVVGHKQLLPDEIHNVAGGDLNAAVILYGADAFKVLGPSGHPAPVVADVEPVETEGETGEDAGTEPEAEGAPAGRRSRRKG